MFTPKWKKEAKLLAKGAQKFVNYKRDLLTQERVEEIESRRDDVLKAIKEGNQAKAHEAGKQLRATCENSLKYEKPVGWLEENVEVMFVAIVIALGLRAYYLQPFRIPTGSMQPTLNGIIGTPLKKADWPSFPQRMAEFVLRGRKYVRVVNETDRRIAADARGNMVMRDTQFLHFFSRSEILFADSTSLELPAPLSPCRDLGLMDAINTIRRNNGILPAGTVVCEGTLDSGDLVLVNKFAYHFRKPKRGEVFVFDTNGIKGIHDRSGDQAEGSHYIKRLCGLPGDTLSIQSPNLLIDGKIATEPGIQRVARGGPPFTKEHRGYNLANGGEPAGPNGKPPRQYLSYPTNSFHLAADAPPGQREYAALGDNTGNSLDSRYWGSVKEYNLLGPGLFSLWPITTGHWGFIH
jgi:signal peptidase I